MRPWVRFRDGAGVRYELGPRGGTATPLSSRSAVRLLPSLRERAMVELRRLLHSDGGAVCHLSDGAVLREVARRLSDGQWRVTLVPEPFVAAPLGLRTRERPTLPDPVGPVPDRTPVQAIRATLDDGKEEASELMILHIVEM